MEHHITDMIFATNIKDKSVELEQHEKQIYTKLSALIPIDKYLPIEEDLNKYNNELEKEMFYRGFMEGIHFLLKCL